VTVNVDENAANGTSVVNIDDANTGTDTDGDGDAITYSITAGNGAGIFTINSGTGEITVLNNASLDYETAIQHVLTVEASDGSRTDTATITIDVNNLNDNDPLINDATVNVDENAANGTSVANIDDANSGTDTDGDGDAITYTITAGNGAGIFTINSGTGDVTVLNNASLDYESAIQHILTVEASDGTGTDTALITIDVNNLNDIDPLINDAVTAIDENAANGTNVFNVNDANTGTDTDGDGAALNYSISAGNASGLFAIDASSGQITIADNALLDYESVSAHALTILASDGSRADTAVITVTVNDVNEAPSVTINPVITAIDEDTVSPGSVKVADIIVNDDALGSATLTLTGADAALFDIINGDELHLRAGVSLDATSNPLLDVIVRVNDAGLPANTASNAALSVTVNGVNAGGGGGGGGDPTPDPENDPEPGLPAAPPVAYPISDAPRVPVLDERIVEDIVVEAVELFVFERDGDVEGDEQTTDIAEPQTANDASIVLRTDSESLPAYKGRFEDEDYAVIMPLFREKLEEITNELMLLPENVVDLSLVNTATMFPSLQLSAQLFQVIDAMQEQMVLDEFTAQQIRLIVGTITITLSVGYLGWVIKGAYLMSGVFSAKRLARNFDPIAPIAGSAGAFYRDENKDDNHDLYDDSVDSMFGANNANLSIGAN
jgi:hypothetical protein